MPITADREDSGALDSCSSSHAGLDVMAFVVTTPSCKSAMLAARSLLHGHGVRSLTLVHALTGEQSPESAAAGVAALAAALATDPAAGGFEVRTEVLCKPLGQCVAEALAQHAALMRPDLVICTSSKISQALPAQARPMSGVSGTPPRPGRTSAPSLPGTPPRTSRPSSHGSSPLPSIPRPGGGPTPWNALPLSIKIAQEVADVPVLLVKSDPRSSGALRPNAPRPLYCMLELQATSRVMLEWATSFLVPGRDHLLLAVANAYEREGIVKPTAARMLTSFGVQASTSGFSPATRTLRGTAPECLPAAVADDTVSLLCLQASRSRFLPPCIVDVVTSSACSVMIYPTPSSEASATPPGRRQATVSNPGSRPASAASEPLLTLPGLRPRSVSSDTGIAGNALPARTASNASSTSTSSAAGISPADSDCDEQLNVPSSSVELQPQQQSQPSTPPATPQLPPPAPVKASPPRFCNVVRSGPLPATPLRLLQLRKSADVPQRATSAR